MKEWACALTLDADRAVVAGSEQQLADAIRCGADLRILTEFRHDEHIDVTSDCDELVREVAEFAVTYLVDDRWTAGVMSLRQPVDLPTGFGPRPSMSYFLYNQDGTQAIARLHIDGAAGGRHTRAVTIGSAAGDGEISQWRILGRRHERAESQFRVRLRRLPLLRERSLGGGS